MEYGCWKMAGKTVGGGRQGQVELVTDASGKESGEFALKKLKDDRRIQRFKQEIDAVARLNHPNIIRIVDHRVDQKPYYYVMEYCEGGSLEKIGGRLGLISPRRPKFWTQSAPPSPSHIRPGSCIGMLSLRISSCRPTEPQ